MKYKAAVGNRRLTDFDELKDIVISHRIKTRNVRCAFTGEKSTDHFLDEFTK